MDSLRIPNRNDTSRAAGGATLKQLRAERRRERLHALQHGAAALVAGQQGWEVWLFGSWARGDWDSRSDVDQIAVAPAREDADRLADGLLSACLGDDVIALEAVQWQERRHSQDPHWCGIARDAIRWRRQNQRRESDDTTGGGLAQAGRKRSGHG